jgi:uncharacterized protein YlxP (DUF503 family)
MIVATVKITLYAPWVHSLKEKRMIVKSLKDRLANRFRVSVAEVESQDTHQMIVLGIACVAGSTALADSIIDKILAFIEDTQEAQITQIEREIR